MAVRNMLPGASRLLFFRKRHPAPGSRPGTLVPPSESPPPVVRSILYGPEGIVEQDHRDVGELAAVLQDPRVCWIDIQGLGDEALLRRLGEIFQLHPLALEDAVNVPQRPKFEDYEHQQLFITRMAQLSTDDGRLDIEQVSLFLGPRYVLTLQERQGDTFDPVRRRLRAGKGPLRRSGADYLAYALIDAVLDAFYPVVEAIGDRLHDMEELVLLTPGRAVLHRIHAVRRELLALRRAVWPQREAVAGLMHQENEFVTDEVRKYLRDCHDHAVQIADVIETYREFASNLMDIYLSSVGQRTNEVMKVLTIMASIFIPLTFLAGIYGMNFEHMPELRVPWAYPALLGVMTAVAVALLAYFYRKGWLGSSAEDEPD